MKETEEIDKIDTLTITDLKIVSSMQKKDKVPVVCPSNSKTFLEL